MLPWVIGIVVLFVTGSAVARQRATPDRASTWLRVRELPDDEASVEMAQDARAHHELGKWLGAGSAVLVTFVAFQPLWSVPPVWMLGSGIGVVVAETFRTHGLASAGSAVLAPRDASGYVEPVVRWWWFAAAAPSAVALVAGLAFEPTAGPEGLQPLSDDGFLLLVAAYALTRAAAAFVLRRPQRLGHRLAAVDDACRAAAIHAVVGCGLGVALIGASMSLSWLAGSYGVAGLDVVGTLTGILALGAWSGFGTRFVAVGHRDLRSVG